MDEVALFSQRDEQIRIDHADPVKPHTHEGFCRVVGTCLDVVDRLAVHNDPLVVKILLVGDVLELAEDVAALVEAVDVILLHAIDGVVRHSLLDELDQAHIVTAAADLL